MTVRVLLVDDQVLIRSGFAALINSADDLEVVGEAGDGGAAVQQAAALLPDVVLMDIRMPGTDGLSAARQITASRELSGVRIIVLTTFEADEYVVEALRSGASGFLGKSVEPDELLDAIRVVARGEALLSPRATRGLIARFLAQPGPPSTTPPDPHPTARCSTSSPTGNARWSPWWRTGSATRTSRRGCISRR